MTPDSVPGAPPARGRAVDLNAIRRTDMVLDLLAGRRLPRPHSLGDRALVLLAGLAADTDDVPLPSRLPAVPGYLSGAGFPGSPGCVGGAGLASGPGHPHGVGHASGPGHVHGLGYVSGQGRAGGLGQASGPGRDNRPGAVIRLGLASGTTAADDRALAGPAGPRIPGPGQCPRPACRPGSEHRPGPAHRPGPGQRWQAAVRLSGRPRQAAGGWARSLAAVMTIVASMAVATGLMVAGMFTRRGGGRRH